MRENKSVRERLEQNRKHFRMVFERLKEQDKRYVAGLLALRVGHGGVSRVAEVVGLERDGVSRGKAEVENGLEGRPVDRQRLPGSGRKTIEKKVPKSSRRSKKYCRPNERSTKCPTKIRSTEFAQDGPPDRERVSGDSGDIGPRPGQSEVGGPEENEK